MNAHVETGHLPKPAQMLKATSEFSILALDLGTTTGFACGRPGAVISSTWDLKPGRHDGGGMRFVKFRARLNELKKATGFNIVYFEEVRRHVGTGAAHVYGGLMATLTEWCESQEPKVPYKGVPVGTIKKHATGRGNASKEELIAAARAAGHEPADDNEADAICIFYLAHSELLQ